MRHGYRPTLNKAKKAIKKAFENQMDGEGFTIVEVALHLPHQLGQDAPGGL